MRPDEVLLETKKSIRRERPLCSVQDDSFSPISMRLTHPFCLLFIVFRTLVFIFLVFILLVFFLASFPLLVIFLVGARLFLFELSEVGLDLKTNSYVKISTKLPLILKWCIYVTNIYIPKYSMHPRSNLLLLLSLLLLLLFIQ